jgi:hypothetical protein
LVWLSAVAIARAQDSGQAIEVGIIDPFGLNRVSAADVRSALTVAVGDRVAVVGSPPPWQVESENRLLKLPNVAAAHIWRICCDRGRLILFVGIQEIGAPVMRFREAPRGKVNLKADVIAAGAAWEEALRAAVRRGQVIEDDSQGHALASDPAQRAIQERFIVYAARDESNLRRVLRKSSDPAQRALAVQVLAYAADKRSIGDDLTFAMTDPDEGVRNNAMRALSVLSRMTPSEGQPTPLIPPAPFIAFLNSPSWTDRNKASFALLTLTQTRDPQLLAALRKRALTSLVEMARWKSEGHAMPAFIILGRIGGASEADIFDAWTRGNREAVIAAASEDH